MNAQLNQDSRVDSEVIADLARFSRDPLGYCLYEWPNADLRAWQAEWYDEIGQRLRAEPHQPIQTATASGHGIGKSSGAAMLCNWGLKTCEMARGVVTANTDTQLRTKTWPEVTKWHESALTTRLTPGVFKITATAIFHSKHERNWRIDAIPWSEHNPEAFAGMHNEGKRIVILFDEASAIADTIYEVTEGALTDEGTEILWCVQGNPTRTTGKFRECFGGKAHRWITRQIDARNVEGTNKKQIAKWVEDYGEDSDFVRVRVRGLFPRASAQQFIGSDIVAEAMQRQPLPGLRDPLIMAVDVARGGNDNLVISFRRGLDARSIPWIVIPGSETRNTERVVAKVVDLATSGDRFHIPDAIIVDETGVGGPIVDRLRGILGDDGQVYGCMFSEASPDPKLANMRMYIWWQMRESLRLGLAIPNDPALEAELTAPEYYHDKRDKVILESKEDMALRLPHLGSPDRADALAISFAYKIQPRDNTQVRGMQSRARTDYDPIARNLGQSQDDGGYSRARTDYDPWSR